jgi:Amidohydrolase
MMDAYTHLDMSASDPIGDLQQRMNAAHVHRALIVETWGKENRPCLEALAASPSPRFRVAWCFRPDEGALRPELLASRPFRALRVRTADIGKLGPLAHTLESAGRWLLPHAESGIGALARQLVPLAARHPGLQIFLPHLGWPRRDGANDEDWHASVSTLSTLPHMIVGISAIAHFSWQPFPHADVEPFARHLREVFPPESIVPASDYPLFEKHRYADYMKLAEDWTPHRGPRLESSLFETPVTEAHEGTPPPAQ